jgi:heme oxygenase-like protein
MATDEGVSAVQSALLPPARGAITERLFARWRGEHNDAGQGWGPLVDRVICGAADDDAQLALHCIYELSYRGFDGVDERFETDPCTQQARAHLEARFEAELRAATGDLPHDACEYLAGVASASGAPSLSAYMENHGKLSELREFVVHRSAYQLKEADPHSWGYPRLAGRAKAAFVTIQHDEYGRGRPGAAHAELFAHTMTALDLDAAYGHYLPVIPGVTLATGNLISMFGMQRRLLPALVGHLALFEMTSVGPMARYSRALARLGVPRAGREFYDVHVVADEEHGRLALAELVGGFLADHPAAGREVVFGAAALSLVEAAFTDHLLSCWTGQRSSLRTPLPAAHPDAA